MTIPERLDAFQAAFPANLASWPWLAREQRRDVLYGVWVIGNDYRNKTRYYGAYPKSYLARVLALFPDVRLGDILHAYAGSVQAGPWTRLDLNALTQPDVIGSVYDAATILPRTDFRLVCADPPYGDEDAEKYGTEPVDRRRATAALATVTAPGGHLCWLDTAWPMHSKKQWLTVGRILVQRSTNHRARVLTIFERQ